METNRANRAKTIRRLGRGLSRGVTLVEVLIVVTIMAIIAGGATLVLWPKLEAAKVRSAYTGASVIKTAADQYQNLGGGGEGCPTLQALVSAKQIDANKTDDPWGQPYRIKCEESEIRVYSLGKDKKEGSPDDIRDNMRQSEINKIAEM
ncbi:prepilin-type N-terminal cleavage/methylation domain-containing protein [Sorangium sp. So ce394]|uniref:prepilin-type N-terminal cleavage/methylation domain-containing protein n=1 Tax=unclassified Sorangium TaxID=2621164 RepID=UPI003F5AE621